MVRLAFALACYALAMLFIWSGIQISPDMTWPKTDLEWISTYFLISGISLKILGHLIFAKLA